MANPYTKVTPQMEQKNKYYEAHKKWKKEKPTIKSLFNNKMGAFGSDMRNKNQAKLDKAKADWKAREPKMSNLTGTSTPTKTKTKTPPKTEPKKPSGKVGQGTVLKNISPKQQKKFEKKIDKVFDKIRKNAKGGKSGFGRKLLGNLKFSGSGKRTAMRGKSAYKVNRSRPTPKNK
jgi:hypothetical protein